MKSISALTILMMFLSLGTQAVAGTCVSNLRCANGAYNVAAELAGSTWTPGTCINRAIALKSACKSSEPLAVFSRDSRWGISSYADPGLDPATILQIINSMLLDE